MLDVEIRGIEEIKLKMAALSEDAKYKGGRFALRKAANLIAEKAKANAASIDDPSTAENIAENIAVRWSGRTFKQTGNLKFRVGILGGARKPKKEDDKQNPGGTTYHWRYLEFGTEKMKAQPFMRRALSENIAAATNEFADQFDKALSRAIKKSKKGK